jgi:hypothetical protein
MIKEIDDYTKKLYNHYDLFDGQEIEVIVNLKDGRIHHLTQYEDYDIENFDD